MKQNSILAIAVIVSAALITSCSIEKRHYMNGYYVNWNKSAKTEQVAPENSPAQVTTQEQNTTPVAFDQQQTTPSVTVTEVPAAAQTPGVQATSNKNTVNSSVNNLNNTTVNKSDVVKSAPQTIKAVKVEAKKNQQPAGDPNKGLLIVLCFLLPWLAVGLATDWDVRTVVINLLWSLTCIGGIIHALIVVNREVK